MGGLIVAILIILGLFFAISVFGGILELFVMVVIWMVAGTIAGRLLRGRGYGPFGDIVLGIIGGLIGWIVLTLLGLGGLAQMWLIGSIIAGVVGAVILVYLVRALFSKDFAK